MESSISNDDKDVLRCTMAVLNYLVSIAFTATAVMANKYVIQRNTQLRTLDFREATASHQYQRLTAATLSSGRHGPDSNRASQLKYPAPSSASSVGSGAIATHTLVAKQPSVLSDTSMAEGCNAEGPTSSSTHLLVIAPHESGHQSHNASFADRQHVHRFGGTNASIVHAPSDRTMTQQEAEYNKKINPKRMFKDGISQFYLFIIMYCLISSIIIQWATLFLTQSDLTRSQMKGSTHGQTLSVVLDVITSFPTVCFYFVNCALLLMVMGLGDVVTRPDPKHRRNRALLVFAPPVAVSLVLICVSAIQSVTKYAPYCDTAMCCLMAIPMALVGYRAANTLDHLITRPQAVKLRLTGVTTALALLARAFIVFPNVQTWIGHATHSTLSVYFLYNLLSLVPVNVAVYFLRRGRSPGQDVPPSHNSNSVRHGSVPPSSNPPTEGNVSVTSYPGYGTDGSTPTSHASGANKKSVLMAA